MPKFIQKIKQRINEKLDKWATKRYIRIKRKFGFVLETKEVSVKKGKRRYTLVVAETNKGSVVFNLGRHELPAIVRANG